MEYDTLKDLAEQGLTQREIASEVGKSQTTVKYWLKKHELRTVRAASGRTKKHYSVKEVGDLGRRAILECPDHGYGEYYFVNGSAYSCKKCNSQAVLSRKRRYKNELIAKMGGSCSLCGYDRSVEALEFHHLDPVSKEFNLSDMTKYSKERVWKEAEKCILVCSNCHREIEAGIRVP